MRIETRTYYWFDTEHAVLYRGEYDEELNRIRETEEAVLWDVYEKADANPYPADAQELVESWDRVDEYIAKELGFLPDYDVN